MSDGRQERFEWDAGTIVPLLLIFITVTIVVLWITCTLRRLQRRGAGGVAAVAPITDTAVVANHTIVHHSVELYNNDLNEQQNVQSTSPDVEWTTITREEFSV